MSTHNMTQAENAKVRADVAIPRPAAGGVLTLDELPEGTYEIQPCSLDHPEDRAVGIPDRRVTIEAFGKEVILGDR